MHLTPSDPDIATLYRKIKQDRLDLQPNFQRGEVWGKAKKQRLIDSILRGWHIPPIHVIQVPNSDKQEVLDGQQRLVAIRDFIEGEFSINGNLDPVEDFIKDLDGLSWSELPSSVSGKIEDFTVRLLTISDYKPGEPGELFYRLNQPTNLTSAEQRNAYFGEARQQVKDLSEMMVDLGFSRETLGFSNSRMAYDDVLSKFLLTLEMGTLKKKITANTVTSRYRDTEGFDSVLVSSVRSGIETLYQCISNSSDKTKLNKASALSWLIFINSASRFSIPQDRVVDFFDDFERIRKNEVFGEDDFFVPKGMSRGVLSKIIAVYLDRSSSRVADTSSVILRDLCLWGVFVVINGSLVKEYSMLFSLYKSIHYIASLPPQDISEKSLEEVAALLDWGREL